jgi:hypothetical protein
MHLTTKAYRALDQINMFLARSYPEAKKISYESTKSSLRYHQSVIQSLVSKGVRKENFRGSHYMQCTNFKGGCECERDNAQILDHISSVNRLIRGM